MKLSKFMVAAAALFAGVAANAYTFDTSGALAGGVVVPYQSVQTPQGVQQNTTDLTVRWRGVLGEASDGHAGQSFLAFCIEPQVEYLRGKTSTYSFAPTNDPVLQQFFDANYASVNSATATDAQKAGFGVALWEVLVDGASSANLWAGTNDLGALVGYSKADVAAAAQGYLDAFSAQAGKPAVFSVIRMDSDVSQDLAFAVPATTPQQPIPEPSTYALMAFGLAAVGFAARRKARRA